MVVYSLNQSWIDERAQTEGVYLAQELLSDRLPENRSARLQELQQHFAVNLELVSIQEIELRIGRSVRPGERIPLKVSALEEWYFLVLDDGSEVLAVGPVNPMSAPAGLVPIGLILAIIGLPIIAVLVALQVERRLTRVEHASQALAAGDLSVRVNGTHASYDELAKSFNTMAQQVESLMKKRDELVQAVSHELGSPLSRLRFHMELLETQSEKKQAERRKAMTRELDALDELVAELLTYVQSDDSELYRQSFDPIRGLTDLAELARLEAPEDHSVAIELRLPESACVYGDQRLFQRTVENILRNAVQYARSEVAMELTEKDGHILLAVHDDGPGIPPELTEKVKSPFVRLQTDRGRKTGGVGLGLAIVSRIMDRHDGRLEIKKSDLGGAMVTTWWPKSG
jgi:signal transduction histidine kinase